MLAYDYPVLGVFWSILLFFLQVMWFSLLFRIIGDVFRSDDLSGWGKAAWLIFLLVVPFLGVLVYVIARGDTMGQRDVAQAQAQNQAFQAYVRDWLAPEGQPISWPNWLTSEIGASSTKPSSNSKRQRC